MSPVDFPESSEALSPAWLTEHFQSTGVINADNQVTALEIKPVGDVIGVVARWFGATSRMQKLRCTRLRGD